MALEVIKPPLQPASVGSYGNVGSMLFTQTDSTKFSAENCNPNMDKPEFVKSVKKTPVKSKTATLSEHGLDMGKSPVRRRLDCEQSPAKAVLLKEGIAASPHKHFCRSPRCAANNPDYAVPAPRQYLKSKRHLLAGWQPPLNSKLRGEHTTNGCSSTPHTEGEQIRQGEDQNDSFTSGETVVCGYDGKSLPADHPQPLDSQSTLYGEPLDRHANGEELVAQVKDRTEAPAPERALSTLEPVRSCEKISAAGDFENTEEVVLSTSACMRIGEEGEEEATSTQNQEVLVHRADPTRASTKTESDFSMGSDSRRETLGSSRPPRRRYHRKGGRRLSSVGTASNQSVTLNKQEGLKRKQAEEWMWDTAVKDAVQRLAPQVPVAGCVNVLVKAFESVKLTEEEILRAKYKNDFMGSPLQGGAMFDPHVSQMETMASINKVQAWDESMASADLNDEMITDKGRLDQENGSSTPKRSQARIPQFSSKSEPPKVAISRWASGSDESMNGTKDDGGSERGASSSSGKSRITEWTFERKSQAGHMRKQKLKRCTSLHPFRLRTEERGAVKEYVFTKRLQQLWEEEERLRIPLAQGLPWTTEEPAVPPKPLVKEHTKPEKFKLFTDVRAIVRAEFDEYVAERNSQMELQRQEEERQRQIAEEEEVKRLRREMVPRAQLMPYFDRPFMPRRSSKKLTVPKEPKFHLKQNKRPRCMASCNSIAA